MKISPKICALALRFHHNHRLTRLNALSLKYLRCVLMLFALRLRCGIVLFALREIYFTIALCFRFFYPYL